MKSCCPSTSHRRNIEDQEIWRGRHCSCGRGSAHALRLHERWSRAVGTVPATRGRHHDQRHRAAEPADPDEHQRGRWRQDRRRRSSRASSTTTPRAPSHNDVAESIETDDAQTYTIKLKDGQTFTERRARHRRTRSSTRGTTARCSATRSSRATSSRRSRASATTRTRELTGPRGRRRPDLHGQAERSPSRTSRCASATRRSTRCPSRPSRTSRRSVRTRSATARTCSTAKAPGSTTRRSTSSTNPDYDGARKPQNGGLDIIFYATQDAAYADLQGGNLDVLDADPRRRARDLRGRVRRPCGQPAARRSSSRSRSRTRLPHFERRGGRAPSRRHLDGDQPRGDHRRDLPGHPHPGARLHVARHRRLLRGHPRLRGPRLRRRRGEGAVGRGRRHRPVGRHRSRSPTTPTAATRPGSTRWRTSIEEQPRHRRVGQARTRPSPSSRTAITDRTIQTGVPHRLAGRLPVAVQLPRADLRAPVPARTTATTRTPSSTRS